MVCRSLLLPHIDYLHLASRKGNIETALALVAKGASVNALNHAHRTPLACAAMRGHDSVCMGLVSAGADASILDYKARSPSALALREGHNSLARDLEEAKVVQLPVSDPTGLPVAVWQSTPRPAQEGLLDSMQERWLQYVRNSCVRAKRALMLQN